MAQGPDLEPGAPDDWWWFAVSVPTGLVHLYELGYAPLVDVLDDDGEPTGEQTRMALSTERHDEIMAELGAPADLNMSTPGWKREMSPGRPNRYLEPKAYGTDGKLLPMQARMGVVLHLHETSPQ